MLRISALHGNVDPLRYPVVTAEEFNDTRRRKRGKWTEFLGENVLSWSEVFVEGLIEADKIAVRLRKVIADESCSKLSIDDGDLLQAV